MIRLNALLCVININTKWAFVRQCNFDGKKNNDSAFTPTNSNQKMLVEAGDTEYGNTIGE